MRPFLFLRFLGDDELRGLCKPCQNVVRKCVKNDQRRLWKSLPKAFNLVSQAKYTVLYIVSLLTLWPSRLISSERTGAKRNKYHACYNIVSTHWLSCTLVTQVYVLVTVLPSGGCDQMCDRTRRHTPRGFFDLALDTHHRVSFPTPFSQREPQSTNEQTWYFSKTSAHR